MKKICKTILMLLPVVLASLLLLTACGGGKKTTEPVEHKHTYAATWSYDGEYHWFAATCEHKDKQDCKMTHVFKKRHVESTCTEGGYDEYTCGCGYSYRDNETDKGEHIYSERKVAATCTEGGYTLHECVRCGDGHRTDETQKLGHDFAQRTVAATCTEGGYHLKKCLRCGYEERSEETEKLGHNLVHYDGVDPTCTQAGKTGYDICLRGDHRTYSEEIPATGHSFNKEAWLHDGTHHWHPATCEHTGEHGDEEAHDFSNSLTCKCGYTYAAQDEEYFVFASNGNEYTVNGLSELGLSGLASGITTFTVPLYYNEKHVTAVKDNAFENVTGITGIDLGAVTRIGKEAFRGCTGLQTVTFSAKLNAIGSAAFAGCTSLTAAALPATLKDLGAYAFDGCEKLASVTMPSSLDGMGDQVFANCAELTEITVPNGVSVIGENMFLNCVKLATVHMPKSGVTKISTNAFRGCVKLESISLADGLTYIGQYAFEGSGLKSVTVPDSVTTIASYAFNNCRALTVAKLSAGVNYTFGNWFAGCAALQEVTVPFVGTNVSGTDSLCSAFGYLFGTAVQSDGFTAVEQDGKTYYIPDSLTKVTVLGGHIGANAFTGCTHITEIVLHTGVTEDTDAFAGCSATVTRLSA